MDNFSRAKQESITQAMARATSLIQKLRPTSSTAAWPEISDNMRKTILKQIVTTSTKSQLTYEEARMNASGGHCNVDSLITMAHQWEMAHGQAPDKKIETVYSTASCTPKYSAQEIKKVQANMNKPIDISKHDQLDAKIDKLLELASTTFTKREPSKERYTQDQEAPVPTKPTTEQDLLKDDPPTQKNSNTQTNFL